MRFWDYCKDRIELILLFSSEFLLLSLFLSATGYDPAKLILILTAQLIIAGSTLCIGYVRRKRYFDELDSCLRKLDQRYLIAEVMRNSYRFEDKKYREILRLSNKTVIERIHALEQEQKEYKEYIESWIHEVKTPLTTINLICENHKDDTTRKILTEAAKVDNLVEMALFYARADHVYQDYLLREVNLYEAVTSVLMKNRQTIRMHGVSIELKFNQCFVLSDLKWIEFILNQIVLNAVKYAKQTEPCISFSIEQGQHQQSLIIHDNGIGIPEHEITRVFEKGFTGSNGRSNQKSTGIGLYLCKQLSDKLGIGIMVSSKEGSYTRVRLTFPEVTLTHTVFQNCKIHESKTDTSR